ncbi:oligopeptide/dipeptide ABC transporter, ATPase subunit [Leptothrix cholodnii SP-6]|uniref:Oligopeptide/dipeptide ABC transporter, ATPase subunit n=1 Tax=Leptothrix cholodnii (strain ATCC 51168 / LMG 8142 / SP-6) TaxID=395495 RepID=B1Y1J8_LEPCP|nr:ABC transporter ATP-binding protein [Leptothrix cholodnii]ACB34297.1 oligopeptide/dipeptide ABC transporter, ATPase subunit [Leptothrix cholodnii SP-6]
MSAPGVPDPRGEAQALRLDQLQVALDVDQADAALLRAVDGLSLAIRRGETFALVGESGCGKSMTALALMRVLPHNGFVESGSVRLGRTELLDLPEAQMRRVRGGRIGMIFQEPSTSLNPVMTVGAQLREAIEAHTALRGAAARARAVEWLARVGLPEPARCFDDYPFRLSGGQQQRVMIAIALAAEPDFLIADEPTTALDVTIQAQILDLLRDLQREHQMGLLLITHDLAVVAGMAQQVALMYAGQIVEVGSAEAFFAAPRHPYAQLLLQALPDGARRGRPLAAIGGAVPSLAQQFNACRFAPRCPHAQDVCLNAEPTWVEMPPGHGLRCARAGDAALDHAAHGRSPAPSITPSTGRPMTPPDARLTSGATPVPLLAVEQLRVTFSRASGFWWRSQSGTAAVDGISLQLARGRTLALVGESGSGKTTTGKAIAQLLRRQATCTGRALLDGRDLFTLQGSELRAARREVQLIFQDPYASLNPRMRVADILAEGLIELRPELSQHTRKRRVDDLAEQVGLPSRALQAYPHEFSGGQRQRIAIARALAVEPRLLICDEPTSALDVSVQAQILNLLRQLQHDTGVALLFITHHLGVVEYLADEVAVMQGGRIVEVGTVDQVLGAPRRDYTRALLAAVPRLATRTGP